MIESTSIIQITFDRMKHTVTQCISEQDIKFDEKFRHALDLALDPANIQKIINEQVEHEVLIAMQDSVKNHFKYGKGRQFIDEAVTTALSAI